MIEVKVRNRGNRYLQLYYIDDFTGQYRTKSSGTLDLRTARLKAAEWQVELNANGPATGPITWEAFRLRLKKEHYPHLANESRKSYTTALNALEKHVGVPRKLAMVDASLLSKFAASMLEKELQPHTIAKNIRHVRSALSWANSLGLLKKVPKHKMRLKGKRAMKGRPLTEPEFQKLLKTVHKVEKEDPLGLIHRLNLMWLTGLRLEEVETLSWDSPPIQVDLNGGSYPRLIFHGQGQKSREDEIVPLAPDAALYLKTMKNKRGPVVDWIYKPGPKLSAVGIAAGIGVNDRGKCASAQDMRRSFGTRWAQHVMPAVLQKMMRHKKIETTMQFYVSQNADATAAAIVHAHVHAKRSKSGKTSKSRPKKPR